jgi:hypothetical protein
MGLGIANSLPGEFLSSSISAISVVFLYIFIHGQNNEEERGIGSLSEIESHRKNIYFNNPHLFIADFNSAESDLLVLGGPR